MAKATPFTVRLRKAKNGDNLLLIVTSNEVTKTIKGVVGSALQENLAYFCRQTSPFPPEWDGAELTEAEFLAFKKEGV